MSWPDDPLSALLPAADRQRPMVAVVGPSDAGGPLYRTAQQVGRLLAERGAVVVTGGLGGVMAAAARGAHDAGGTVVGVLPGTDTAAANPFVDVAVPTGLGEYRNALVVRDAVAVIAVGGSWGTLSEVALAVRTGRPVAAVGGWRVTSDGGAEAAGVAHFGDADHAVRWIVAQLERSGEEHPKTT